MKTPDTTLDKPAAPAAATAAAAPAKTRPKRKPSRYEEVTAEKKAFGERLVLAREVAGFSQKEAADALGFSQGVQLSLMEAGKRPTPLPLLIKCAQLYGTTMDYLCGLASDSDRDPAVAIQRHVAARLSADLQHLIKSMAQHSADVARELLPSAADGQRLSSLVIEANMALAVFRQRNPKFDEMRGGSNLALKLTLATEAASRYASQVERGHRLMTVRTMKESDRQAAALNSQLSLLPALETSTA